MGKATDFIMNISWWRTLRPRSVCRKVLKEAQLIPKNQQRPVTFIAISLRPRFLLFRWYIACVPNCSPTARRFLAQWTVRSSSSGPMICRTTLRFGHVMTVQSSLFHSAIDSIGAICFGLARRGKGGDGRLIRRRYRQSAWASVGRSL